VGMSIELLQDVLRERAARGEEGLLITVIYKGKLVGVTIDPCAIKDLLAIDVDAPEGEGIPLHNFLQRYFTPALNHLKYHLEDEEIG